MTPDQIDLARRAVACPRWRWLPGMVALIPPADDQSAGYRRRISSTRDQPPARAYPDLSDPATLGCLVVLVREAWGNPRLVAIYCEPAHPGQSEGWVVQCADGRLPVAGEDHLLYPDNHPAPTPEMVSIPAPPGGEYAVMETDNLCAVTAFSIGKYPVTQAEWQAVMGSNPSRFRGDPRLPVENVSWEEAVAFCEKLSDAHGLTGTDRYRLPTEAEWEWAASGGIREDRRVTDDTGWYEGNSGGQTHPVGQKKPNGFGLHDTLGNVWEWTSTEEGSLRVGRGGGWFNTPALARVAFRDWIAPGVRYQNLGFRLARGA